MKTAIVTDTNSGMSVEEGIERGIYVLPMPVIINETTFREGENITFREIFQAMEDGKTVTTSSPSPYELKTLWDRTFKDGFDEMVYIPMSSGLSSSCTQAGLLAQQYGGRVHVVDNHRISLTQYESVLDAKAMADAGWDGASIRRRLEMKAYEATIYLAVSSLDYLRKSGRVTTAALAMAALLKICPILTIQGEKLDAFGKARGMRSAVRRMLDATAEDMKERMPGVSKAKILVGAAGSLVHSEEIERLSERVRDMFPGFTFLYHPLTCSIACHTGPGAAGVGFVAMERVDAVQIAN